ncbi:right-handed parallel beta-helix repeat-containing protein [Falsiroseomonas sp.]|jgi:hypothetical protein|uniref:right-handed parallel beta-helix repeat-containing protein n=1 Tax=Falsiroseomonas sp. TaxID=2870721 RepID=UPI003F711FAB
MAADVNILDYGANGDGAFNNTPAFIAAIAAAGSGGSVRVPAGNFKVDGETVITFRVRIFGTGTISRDGTSGANRFRTSNAPDVEFQGLRFESSSNTAGGYWIYADAGTARLSVRDCAFKGGLAIGVDGAGATAIENNVFQDLRVGVAVGPLAGSTASVGVVITGNRFLKTRDEGVDLNRNFKSVVVSSNYFLECHLDSADPSLGEVIDIGDPSSTVQSDVTISANVIDGGGTSPGGIRVKGGVKQVTILGNTITGLRPNRWAAVILDTATDVVIHGNTVEGCSRGVSVNGASSASRVTVSGNIFRNPVLGAINMQLGSGSRDITISGNTCDGGGVATEQGIRLSGAAGSLIQSNNVRGFAQQGILVGTGSERTQVIGNNTHGCLHGVDILSSVTTVRGNMVLDFAQIGVYVRPNTQFVTVSENSCFNGNNDSSPSGWAILLESGANFSKVTNNTCIDLRAPGTKKQFGIFVAGSVSMLVADNISTENAQNLNLGFGGPLSNSIVTDNVT